MADTSTRVSGAVEVKQNGREAVAFDLMQKISINEDSKIFSKDRAYWLTLYRQCFKATSGHSLEDILKAE